MPQKVGAFALCESGKRILMGLQTDFAYYWLETFELEWLKQDGYSNPKPWLNDE